ncbi:MAG: SLC13 family permease [Candidatus Thermoplasmatota archaeon]|nr:SLC13 family permease [Candidatus Thermoplasmatota archaeon]MCL5963534.1 SLC13 family permease [Candidatus Thermoplasmatota archaeon]
MERFDKEAIKKYIQKEFLFVIFAVLFIILLVLVPRKVLLLKNTEYQVVLILASIIILTQGIKESKYLNVSAYKLISRVGNGRVVGIFLIFITFIFSMFLTNDIALLITIPFVISIGDIAKKDIDYIIILQAIAANVGSMLFPIGNPQNLLIWKHYNISFIHFISMMAPVVILNTIILVLFYFIIVDREYYKVINVPANVDKKLFNISILIMFIFFILIFTYSLYIVVYFIIIALFYGMYKKGKIIKNIDLFLILTFMLIFIDFNTIRISLPVFQTQISPSYLYFWGIALSQVVSNVPATTLLISQHNYRILAYSVNIGGNGTVIGSIANLIALKQIKNSGMKKFHKISLVFLLITSLMVYMVFIL